MKAPAPRDGSPVALMTVGLLAAIMILLPVVAISVSLLLLILGVWTWPF